jgi:hypothetical protein
LRDKPSSGFSIHKNTASLLSTVKAENNNTDAFSLQLSCEDCTHCHRVKTWEDIKQVLVVATVATAGWDPIVLRREQLNDQYIGK